MEGRVETKENRDVSKTEFPRGESETRHQKGNAGGSNATPEKIKGGGGEERRENRGKRWVGFVWLALPGRGLAGLHTKKGKRREEESRKEKPINACEKKKKKEGDHDKEEKGVALARENREKQQQTEGVHLALRERYGEKRCVLSMRGRFGGNVCYSEEFKGNGEGAPSNNKTKNLGREKGEKEKKKNGRKKGTSIK